MRDILIKFGCISLVALSSVSVSLAAPPDAGQLLREQQPQRQLPQQLPPAKAEKEPVSKSESGIRVTVTGFTFHGYEGLVAESELQTLLSDSIGKGLSFMELQGLADNVTAYLKKKGWFLARAYLPRQDVTSGSIVITIIQGKSDGGVIIKRDSTVRIKENSIRAIAENAVRPGQPLNEQRLERSLLLINDLPGITGRASLATGGAAGSTGIVLDVSEGSHSSGMVSGDNQGNRYTGSWRGNGMLNINDPFEYGDQLSLLITGSEGLAQGRIGYTFPLSPSGLRGNVAYTGMRYDLIDDLAPLNINGQSHTLDAGVSYPLVRSRTVNLNSSVAYQYKNLQDSAGSVDIREKQLHSGILGFNGDQYDTLLSGGYTSWNVGVTTGSLHESIADISITRTEGSYTRFNLAVARLQRLTGRFNLNLSYSGQFSLDNLDSSEKFNLGGPNGVRAYPVGEASGDEGHIFNLDLRYDLPLPGRWGTVQCNGFYDAGQITLHKQSWNNSISSASNRNNYWLQGAGLGLYYAYSSKLTIKTSWAHVIGENPGRSTDNKDSDGKSDENRFWLQGVLYF